MSTVVPTNSIAEMDARATNAPPDSAQSTEAILYPQHLPERVKFDENKEVLTTNLPHNIMLLRNLLIRWTQFEIAETAASLSFGFIRRGIAKTSLFLNLLLISVAVLGLYAAMNMNITLIAFHAITLFLLCSLFGFYVVMIALTGDESWWLLLVIFAFITVDFVVALLAIKFLRSLMAFEKTLTPDSELIAAPSATRPSATRPNQPFSVGTFARRTTAPGSQSRSHNTRNSNKAYSKAAVEQRLVEIERLDCSDAPNQFLCPISIQVMVDPVVALDGHTYERTNIVNWFKTKKTSPMTREAMKTNLVPNQAIKSQIMDYLDRKRQNLEIESL